MRRAAVIAVLFAIALACRGGGENIADKQHRQFPLPVVPTMVDDADAYVLDNYWNGFFKLKGVTDTAFIAGIRDDEVEEALAVFLRLADAAPKDKGQAAVARMFSLLEQAQAEDTSSLLYLRMTELVSKYLYDPNSPMRDEDLYLPFVSGMAASPFTRDEVRPGYMFEERMCRLNRYGTPATDFSFKDAKGHVRDLYDIKAAHTVLFFSNPGCTACKEIITDMTSRDYLEGCIASGEIAVVNIYIDREIEKWREYEPNYPRSWITGYDHKYIIRQNAIYNVRAIPSLYLLDADKKVVMKDVPTEKVLRYLDNNYKQ